jgi:hypothetical protein
MITVTSGEFQQQFERYQDEALRQPITIMLSDEKRLVMMSFEEYRRLKRRDVGCFAPRTSRMPTSPRSPAPKWTPGTGISMTNSNRGEGAAVRRKPSAG